MWSDYHSPFFLSYQYVIFKTDGVGRPRTGKTEPNGPQITPLKATVSVLKNPKSLTYLPVYMRVRLGSVLGRDPPARVAH
jgi:hypothetical protein